MLNNDQNSSTDRANTTSNLSQSPVLQASPSGGVVATLQPGQAGFAEVKTESGRQDNSEQTVFNGVGIPRNKVEVALPQSAQFVETGDTIVANEPEVAAQPSVVQNSEQPTKTMPSSVLNYKIGNDLPKKKTVKWFFPAIFGALALLIVGSLGVYFWQRARQNAQQAAAMPDEVVVTTLDYWGLWEPSETLNRVFREFEASNPGISVNYIKQDINGYRERLQTAIATANGPDLFRYHASWRGYLDNDLAALPSSVMSVAQFNNNFYPVMTAQLTNENGEIKGIPLMYDSLALLYNKDMYTEAGLEAPKTWTQFSQNARKLTKYENNGYIAVSGAAFGLADNVDFVSDIIGMLAVQSGADLQQPSSAIIADVLTFYTNFYNNESQRVWDTTFDNSTLAFARGETAMIFAPSWAIHDILAVNPNLNIGVASVPQLNTENPAEWATYWTEGVNNNSPRKEAAWKLLEYLSSENVLTQLYKEQASIRLFGEIYPRRGMSDLLANNAYLQPYLLNATDAVGYPLNDKTFDEALDDANKAITVSVINALTTDDHKRSTAADLAVDLVEQWQENALLF